MPVGVYVPPWTSAGWGRIGEEHELARRPGPHARSQSLRLFGQWPGAPGELAQREPLAAKGERRTAIVTEEPGEARSGLDRQDARWMGSEEEIERRRPVADERERAVAQVDVVPRPIEIRSQDMLRQIDPIARDAGLERQIACARKREVVDDQ